MDRVTIPNITFNTHDMTVSTTGSGTLSTFPTVSPITSKFKTLERKLHKMFKDNRVLKYEVFRNLNKDDIKVIMNELGNKINVAI